MPDLCLEAQNIEFGGRQNELNAVDTFFMQPNENYDFK
jgi:hypothetical protein